MIRLRNRLMTPLLAVALVAAAGCSSDDDGGPIPPAYIDQTLADDIAQHVAMTLATDNGGWVLGLTAEPATVPAALIASPVGARLSRANRTLRDTTFTVAGVTWTIADTFFTAGGTPQEDYDPATSVRLSLASFGAGTMAHAQFNAIFQHRIRVGAPGLSATNDTLRFAGTARDSSRSWFTSTVGTGTGAFRRVLCVGNIDWEDVGTLKGQLSDAAPSDGFATGLYNAYRYSNGDTTAVEKQAGDVTVLIAFDGSTTVTMQVGNIYEYLVNLRTGSLTKLN